VAETKTSATALRIALLPDSLSFGPQQHAIDTVAEAVQGEKVHS